MDNGEKEELVFTVQGVILKKDLPPVDKPLGKIAFMTQQIVLTGLDCEIFNKASRGLDVVESQFRRNLDEEDVDLHKVGATVDGYQAIELSNRYVTCKGATNGVTEVEMDEVIDPKGYLTALMNERYVRTEENVVEYYELVDGDGGGVKTYVKCPPKRFKKGDLVEAQFSLTCVCLGQRNANKWRMVGVLRSLTLLEGRYTEEAAQAERDSFKKQGGDRGAIGSGNPNVRSESTTSAKSLKRRVGHGTSLENQTRMMIDRNGNITIDNEKEKTD
ncbi:hypothetical protein AAF712_012696 [Marasmius tenuissimus]|uniref:Uncharacterized protein n=1 Tax=Marasmius tenuissimus TaxID=585030 RepID=A0ABR2ZG05_9AGAR